MFCVFLGRLVAFCFLWVGGFPLPRFPCVFPLVLGRVGGCVFFCLPLASRVSLSLSLSLSAKFRLRKPGQPTRKPPPPILCFGVCVLTHLLLAVDGWTRRGTGWGGDRGVCDPAQCLGTMAIAVFVGVSPRVSAPPEIDPGFFASVRFDFGGLFLCATSQQRLGPLRMGIFVLCP